MLEGGVAGGALVGCAEGLGVEGGFGCGWGCGWGFGGGAWSSPTRNFFSGEVSMFSVVVVGVLDGEVQLELLVGAGESGSVGASGFFRGRMVVLASAFTLGR